MIGTGACRVCTTVGHVVPGVYRVGVPTRLVQRRHIQGGTTHHGTQAIHHPVYTLLVLLLVYPGITTFSQESGFLQEWSKDTRMVNDS